MGADIAVVEEGLVGREAELARLRALIAQARAGTSGALVLTGPPGIGKTSLLRAAFGDVDGFAISSVEGVELEAGLAYSALHRLLAPFLPPDQPLAEPQQKALDTVFGVRDGEAPDPFLVGLAALTVLTDVARRTPLAVVVDDVHWIDPESLRVLVFVARRLLAEPVVLIFAARPLPAALAAFAGLTSIELDALSSAAQIKLLERHAGALRPEVANRVVADSAGNPLALIEYARALPSSATSQAAGPDPLPSQVAHLFDHEISALPTHARLLLTVAALEPSGDRTLIRQAALTAGVDLADDPEGRLGRLASIDPRATFAHPLVRSAAHRLATRQERMRIHAALAEAHADAVRRAWHLSLAIDGTDDEAADELERAAVMTRTRGGYSAECELLRRAATLTSDPARQSSRLVRSASAAVVAGDVPRALALLPAVEDSSQADVAAMAMLVRAKAKQGSAKFLEAPEDFAEAARLLRTVDEAASRESWHHALYSGFSCDGLGTHTLLDHFARQAKEAGLDVGSGRTFLELAALGLVRLRTGDRASGARLIREALDDAPLDRMGKAFGIESAFCGVIAIEAFDARAGRRVCERLLARDRAAAALPNLQIVALNLAFFAEREGRMSDALHLMSESDEWVKAYGGAWERSVLHGVIGRGRDAEVEQLYGQLVPAARAAGFGSAVACAQVGRASWLVSRTRYGEAVDELRDLFALDPVCFGTWLLPTLVEAATRSDDHELAQQALQRLQIRARHANTSWADGLLARCRAIAGDASDPERDFHDAFEHLSRADMPFDLAQTRLLYGEWLRRARRRTDAVEQLGAAHVAFVDMGAESYAERAGAELEIAGGRPQIRTPEHRDELTPRERQVAAGAGAGLTNREIATQMFISEATVAYHLRKVFRKLGVTSRRELRGVRSASEGA